MIAGMPRTKRILAVFEPTTLPKAIPGALSKVARMAIKSSGAEVPKATIVKLTIKAGTPSRKLRLTAPFTSASPAKSRITRPIADSSQSITGPYSPPHTHGGFPIIIRPQLLQRTDLDRLIFGIRKRPNMASTAIPTKNNTTILKIISKPKAGKGRFFL